MTRGCAHGEIRDRRRRSRRGCEAEGIDGEEVERRDHVGLGPEELAPGWDRPAGGAGPSPFARKSVRIFVAETLIPPHVRPHRGPAPAQTWLQRTPRSAGDPGSRAERIHPWLGTIAIRSSSLARRKRRGDQRKRGGAGWTRTTGLRIMSPLATRGNRRERASEQRFCYRSRWVISGRFPCTRGPNAAPDSPTRAGSWRVSWFASSLHKYTRPSQTVQGADPGWRGRVHPPEAVGSHNACDGPPRRRTCGRRREGAATAIQPS